MSRPKIIAVDFDGTLCENKFPEIGAPIWEVIDALKAEQANGAKVILWTVRAGQHLLDALNWMSYHSIGYDAVNENIPETLGWLKEHSVKVFAHEYWDDRAVKKP